MATRVLVVATLAWLSPLWANADTTTTVYRYNADGALTSITETSDGMPGSKTTYFTWDNFDAATGTPTAANGNLIGIGARKGGDSIQSLEYDNLDRLVRVTNQQNDTAAIYEYHPDELLAASLNANAPASDGLQHYYSESRYPQVTNLYDRHTGELSSRHRRIRYLEDGTEQMLVRHRKDVDGVYNLGNQTMSGYAYDPYGASLGEQELTGSPPAGPLYSVRNNPYRYTHELQDPVSRAYYLRARWYLPGHQTFLQRDPFPNLNRYGYANGNPVTNYDPSGRSAKPFVRGLEAFGMSALAGFTGGLSVYIEDAVDHRAFFGRDPTLDVESSLQLVMTGAAALSFFGGVVGGLASRALEFGTVGGLVQGGFQVTRHPADMGHVAIGFAGGAVGGFALGLFGGGIGEFRKRLNSPARLIPKIESDVDHLEGDLEHHLRGVSYEVISMYSQDSADALRQREINRLLSDIRGIRKRAVSLLSPEYGEPPLADDLKARIAKVQSRLGDVSDQLTAKLVRIDEKKAPEFKAKPLKTRYDQAFHQGRQGPWIKKPGLKPIVDEEVEEELSWEEKVEEDPR